MTPGARVAAAIELLAEIAATPRPADAVASAFFRARRYIGAKDRSAVAEAVYAVLRRHARLGWWLARSGFGEGLDGSFGAFAAPAGVAGGVTAAPSGAVAAAAIAMPQPVADTAAATFGEIGDTSAAPSDAVADASAAALGEIGDTSAAASDAVADASAAAFGEARDASAAASHEIAGVPAAPAGVSPVVGRPDAARALAEARARVIANAILAEGRQAGSVERLFDGGRFNPEPFSAVESRLAHALDRHTLEHPEMPEAVRAECPGWAEPGLRRALGGRFLPELLALTGPAPLDLRVNPLRSSREAVLTGLANAGIAVQPCRLSPLGVRVEGRPAIAGLELFRSGAIEIQDEGSQLVALLADARPGQQVVDFCAGAGGKALAMAAAMGNKGRIVACDVLGNRLKRAAERLRRGGLHNVETRALSSARDPWVKRHKGMFDRVLVDAPCTGTGTWRRNPDSRWRPLGPGLAELVRLQAEILDSAARLVKPGGRLVYATCSMLAEENEDQVAAFLDSHPEFAPLPLAELWPAVFGAPSPLDGPWLRLTPARHDTDGFFAAVMVRKAAAVVSAALPEAAPDAASGA